MSLDYYKRALKRLNWEEITCWYLWVDTDLKFNHIENGHPTGASPLGTTTQTKQWASGKWSKHFIWGRRDENNLLHLHDS